MDLYEDISLRPKCSSKNCDNPQSIYPTYVPTSINGVSIEVKVYFCDTCRQAVERSTMAAVR